MRGRFTLIELIVVLAVIAVLAAIAIPSFFLAQLKARHAEIFPNVDAIYTAEIAYGSANDGYVGDATFYPDATPGKHARPWVSSYFDRIGWAPDGDVFGAYKAQPSALPLGAEIYCRGFTDLDEDGMNSVYGINILADGSVTQFFPDPDAY